MPYQRRRRRHYNLWKRIRLAGMILLGVTALGGLWWWLAKLGPRAVDPEYLPPATSEQDGELAALQREVASLRDAFQFEAPSEKMELLDEAIAKQLEVIARLGDRGGQAEQRRLSELEAERDTMMALQVNERIQELDAQAQAAQEQGDAAGAQGAWVEALSMQQQVNRSGGKSTVKNFVREGRFEQQLQELEAAPLGAEVAEALKAASRASDADQWSDALAALTVAREVQLRLNAEFPRSRHAGLAIIDEIEREIQSLDAAGMAAEVDDSEMAGDEAMATADYETAVTAYEEARQAQLRLNREFGRSRFLSSPRVESLEVKRQTASSVPLIEAWSREAAAITGMLQRRETAKAAARIGDAAARIDRVFEQLPKSTRLEPALRLQMSFLAAQQDRLGDIQDAVYERLRPLPGVGELQMLRTEVPQSLYLQVMRVNPSRNPGREFPVDSVNWFDANAFCERLAWVLGRPVRLPTGDEYRVAVGEATEAVFESEQAGRAVSRPMAMLAPNAAGFFDLLGNVAEWLAPRADQGEGWALVAGGSFLDAPEVRRQVPMVETSRSERARHVGFRVLVEFPEN